MNGYNIYSQGTFTFYSNPNEDEDRSEWPPSRRPGQGGKDLARLWNCSSTASPGHFWKKGNEARNPKLDTIWCAATLGFKVKTITRE